MRLLIAALLIAGITPAAHAQTRPAQTHPAQTHPTQTHPAQTYAHVGSEEGFFFGSDDRVYVMPDKMPWAAIGKLTFEGGHCSGALVSPRVVLTAAHCLYAGVGAIYDRPQAFLAGYHKGAYTARAAIKSFWIAPGYDHKRTIADPDVAGRDYAFVLLDEPIGVQTGTFDVRAMTEQDYQNAVARHAPRISQAGYSGDTDDQLTAHIGCAIVGQGNPNTLKHECDIVQGDSGSPIFMEAGGMFSIVAINSATYRGPRPTNIAVDARAFAADLRRYIARYDPSGAPGTAIAEAVHTLN